MEWDQLDNGARVEYCGAGVRIPFGQCNAVRIREATVEILNDQRFANAARRIGAGFAGRDHGEPAAELLERFSQSGRLGSMEQLAVAGSDRVGITTS
jgi:UDP:flavonoid glycosyltransferase YjiC (YdhE family)